MRSAMCAASQLPGRRHPQLPGRRHPHVDLPAKCFVNQDLSLHYYINGIIDNHDMTETC